MFNHHSYVAVLFLSATRPVLGHFKSQVFVLIVDVLTS